MEQIFLDTNLFLHHLTQDDLELSARATAYLTHIEQGELQGFLSDVIIFETVSTLQHHYKQAKSRIAANLLPLIELPSIVLRHKRRFRQVFDFYVRLNISFADAYHAMVMKQESLDKIATFDCQWRVRFLLSSTSLLSRKGTPAF